MARSDNPFRGFDSSPEVIDGQLRATATDYNAAHQPVAIKRWRVAEANSCTISVAADAPSETRWRRLAYTEEGMLLSETDANGNVTTLDYDGLGRLYRTIYPDATEAWTLTDERGQARFRRKRAGDWAVVHYDAAGRDYHVTEYDNGATGFEGRNVRAGLDLAGRPVWRDVSTQGATWDDALLRDVRLYVYDDAGRRVEKMPLRWGLTCQAPSPHQSKSGTLAKFVKGEKHRGDRPRIHRPSISRDTAI